TWFKKGQKENPTLSLVVLLADFYDLQQRYPEAIGLYRQILQKDPENRLALNNLAWLLAIRERSTESLNLMKNALELAGPIPDFLDTRGVILLTLNRTKEALTDLEKA